MKSTIEQLDNFSESFIWQDIMEELESWLKDIHKGLEDAGNTMSDKHLHRLGGNAEAVRNFMQMPEQMLMNLKDDLGLEDLPKEGVSNE